MTAEELKQLYEVVGKDLDYLDSEVDDEFTLEDEDDLDDIFEE